MTNKPKSNLCDIFEDCITIHPFRYGLIRTDDYTGFPKIKFPVPEAHSSVQFPDYSFLPSVNVDNKKSSDPDNKEDDKNGKKISFYDSEEQVAAQHSTRVQKSVSDDARTFPSGYKYSYGATPLHEGWLYMYNETDDSVKEYQVVASNGNPLFRLCRLNDIEKSALRLPDFGTIWTKGVNVDKDAVIYMEFSHIQWDPDIIDKMLKNQSMRAESIQKIDVNEWVAGNAQDGVFDYETAKSHYIPNPSDTVGFDFHYADCQEDDSEVFACIHDRVGAANDLCNEITRLELLQESLIASVRTGVSADLALETLLKNPEAEIDNLPQAEGVTAPKKSFEHQYMIAQSTYRALFAELKNLNEKRDYSSRKRDEIEDQAKKVNREAVEKILQIKKRQEIRHAINQTRHNLHRFLKSDYYAFLFRVTGVDYAEKLNDSKNVFLFHDSCLSKDPRCRDADIVTRYDAPLNFDTYYSEKLGEEKSPFAKIMRSPVNMDYVKPEEAEETLLGMVETYINVGQKAADFTSKAADLLSGREAANILSDFLNSAIFAEVEFEVKEETILNVVKYAEEIILERFGQEESDIPKSLLSKAIQNKMSGDGTGKVPTIKVKLKTGNTTANKVAAFFESKGFKRLGAGLAVFNLARALKPSDDDSGLQDALAVGAATFSLIQNVGEYAALRRNSVKILGKRVLMKGIIRGAGIIADGLTIVGCLLDASDAFRRNNAEAAVAYVGAAASATASLILVTKGGTVFLSTAGAGTTAAAALASIEFVILTILLALLTAGMLYIAAYLTHSPLEEFYRNYIFNQKGLKKLLSKNQDADIIALMQLIHLKREDIIDDYFGQWRDYENILLEFESLYPAVLVESPQIVQSEKRMKLSWWQQAFMGLTTPEAPAYFIEERADTITFNCHLLQITPNMDIDFGLLSYSSEEGKMVTFGEEFIYKEILPDKMCVKIKYDISKINKSHFYNDGFFYIRILLDPIRNIYWPRENEKEPRYFFFNIGLKGTKPSLYLFNTTLTRNQDGDYLDYETKKNQWIMSIDEFKSLARINEEKTITKTNNKVFYVD
ncbi:toxin VasX [Marinilabilia salmonicolor]|nr:toxin VasX [Marinilabilia salmonicolor]